MKLHPVVAHLSAMTRAYPGGSVSTKCIFVGSVSNRLEMLKFYSCVKFFLRIFRVSFCG